MANQIVGNPIIVDSAAATVIVSTPFLVQSVLWDPGTSGANADVLTVEDKHGKVKVNQTLLTGNLIPPPIIFEPPLLFDGLIVPTMGHGKVYIYLAQANNLQA